MSKRARQSAPKISPIAPDNAREDSLTLELAAIRQSLDFLRIDLGLNGSSRSPVVEDKRLGIFITRGKTPAKPYTVQCDGELSSTFKLSPIRAAIFIVLMVDLEDRLEGGKGVEEPLVSIEKTLRALEPSGQKALNGELEADSPDRVRVAVYRFWEFCQSTNHLRGVGLELDFDDKRIRLSAHTPTGNEITGLKLEITSNDPEISNILTQTLTRSPTEQVRKRKALFIPSGADGADRFLLEMYDHPYPLTVTSLYVRPPLPSYPDALLEKMAVSPRVRRRKALAFEGYRTGRFQFFEVLHEGTIWDLIRRSEYGGFKLYPSTISGHDIASHIENLMSILRQYENYHLYITKMVVPFVVVTYDIKSSLVPECFTVFFQAFNSAAERDLGCFALYDRAVYQSISEHIVRWISQHPSTIRSRQEVIDLLARVLRHLQNHGPLGSIEPIPQANDVEQT
jgi:hypothetical protein